MCGIAGAVGPGRAVDLAMATRRMNRAQAHRGPDDEGLVAFSDPSNNHVVLGSRRLAILDLSPAGHQPMSNEDGTVSVAYNGEIYNFAHLRQTLSAKGHVFRSRTDTEVILRAYEAYGEECVVKLRGMFAFAVWDTRRQQLLLARDRVGEKPLYYAWDGRRLLFASELRALLASGLVESGVNREAVRGYLHFGSVPSPLTMIQGIRSLDPGCRLTLRHGHVSVTRYWDLAFQEEAALTEGEALEALRSHLREAVALRLASDVPLGAFLSGGVDSSAVVALMREAGVVRLRTFTLSFDHPQLNEAPFARQVAERFETEHTEYRITADEVLGSADRVIAAMDQPTLDGFNTYFVSQLTRGSGTIVALSGLGGDELFGGYSTFWHVPRLCRLGRWLRRVPGSTLALSASAPVLLRDDRANKLRAFLRHAPTPAAAYLTAKGQLLDGAAAAVLADGAAAFDPWTYLEDMGSGHTEHLLNRVCRLELGVYLHNQLLRDTDAMSMAHALEVRAPLLDHRLIECVATIPAAMKFSGRPKRLLLAALGGVLPGEVVNRPKVGFAFPFAEWMRGPWRSTVETRLLEADGDSPVAGLFDRRGLEVLWRAFLAGRVRWSRVWAIVVLQEWLRRHLTTTVSKEQAVPAAAGT